MTSLYVEMTNGAPGLAHSVPPRAARRLDTRQWIMPPDRQWSDSDLLLCGWHRIDDTPKPADDGIITHTTKSVQMVDGKPAIVWEQLVRTPKPADTDTDTHDRSIELVNGTPTVVWTSRPWTADELTARTASANDTTIRTQAEGALDTNRTFLAIASPTNAQTLAQVKALTQQNQRLIRLALGLLDGID